MNRVLKTVFVVHFGIFHISHAMLPVPAFIENIAKTVSAYFGPTPPIKQTENGSITPLQSDPADVELEGLGGFPIKDLFKNANPITTHITKQHTFISHIHLIQNLKERLNLLKEKIALKAPILVNPIAKKKLTQTEAYLSQYQSEIDFQFSFYGSPFGALKDYKKLIDQVIEQEKALSDTHYFFYHAHNKELIILHDFIKLLDGYINLISPRADCSFMRLKNTFTLPYKNVNEYLDAHKDIYDCDDLTRTQMISVNLALFGNHTNAGECTFRYFLNDSSCSVNLAQHLVTIFSYYKFDQQYLTELTDLTTYLTSPTGNLLQICIPYDMVDDLVYLSHAFGPPYKHVVLKNHYCYSRWRHTSIRPLLEHMRTSPHAIANLSHWQARLIFFDPMVDMHPAIKIFRYNTITSKNMSLYQQKLNDIVMRLIVDYLRNSDISGKEPLVKLHHYMMMNGNC